MTDAIQIGPAATGDAPAIAAIYGYYVRESVATFETVPPDAGEMAERMAKVLDGGLPWLVAREAGGAVAGYAYASRWNQRQGYLYSCEDSIYLRHDRLGQGIGKCLLAALIDAAEVSGLRQMVAMIAGVAGSRPVSVALHEGASFSHAGVLAAVGRKHGRWIDVHYMQRALGEGAETPPPKEPE